MHTLALTVTIKADRAVKAKFEVNSQETNSGDNPHAANLTASYTEVTQKLIYKELSHTNLLIIETDGKPEHLAISSISLKIV